MDKLVVSASPHIKTNITTDKLMLAVVIALLPAMLVSFMYFGLGAVKVVVTSVAGCVIFEYLVQRYFIKGKNTIGDFSAILSGLLLAFNLPSSLPIGIILIGCFVTIVITKMSYGGLGKNLFNPALVGRVFLLISFPVHMTNWPVPSFMDFSLVDADTSATVLSVIKTNLMQGMTMSEIMKDLPSYKDLFIGNMGGSLGEVSALALIIGGVYLVWKKIITWHIPVIYIATVFVLTSVLWVFNHEGFANPLLHLLSGGLMLGAIFMATDYVTSPMALKGKVIFAIGCGLLTVVIRLWGAYPEGVSFAILIMNAFVPLIDKYYKPRVFGKGVK